MLALPVECIREVVPGQMAYSPLPVKAEGLLGAVDIRGTIIPVLDLRQSLGLSNSAEAKSVILVMRWQGNLLGLTADEVCGIARLDPNDLFRLTAASPSGTGTLATHAFHSGDEIVTLLDAKVIAELRNIPMVAERSSGRSETLSAATETVLLFSFGRSLFGIDATCVDATVPACRIERNALARGFCLGVIDHFGFHVPVVDTMAALGLGVGAPAAETPVIVVRFSPEAMLGFAVDTVREIASIAKSDILSLPSLAMGDEPLFRGMYSDEAGRQNLLLDADNIRSDPTLKLLAQLRKPKLELQRGYIGGSSASELRTGSPGRTRPFLTYVAGAEHATPLDQVTEIITYPTEFAPFTTRGQAVLGLFTHRGRVAPLVCLATLLGRTCGIDPENARVLFVEKGGRTMGFVVEALRSIETVDWHSPAADPSRPSQTLFSPLVLLGQGDQRRMVSHVDLSVETDKFYNDAGAAPGFGVGVPSTRIAALRSVA